jgi:hypothetical protein
MKVAAKDFLGLVAFDPLSGGAPTGHTARSVQQHDHQIRDGLSSQRSRLRRSASLERSGQLFALSPVALWCR